MAGKFPLERVNLTFCSRAELKRQRREIALTDLLAVFEVKNPLVVTVTL